MDDDREAAHRQLRSALAARDVRNWRVRLLALIARGRKRESVRVPAPEVRSQRRVRLVGIPVAAAVMVLAISAFRPAAERPTPTPVPVPVPPEVVSGDSPATTEPPSPAPPPVPARVWPAEPVSISGNEVRAGDAQWSIGAPGDLVVIGDWDCGGTPMPAVLRPTSGVFYVFDRWAGEAEEVVKARRVRDDLDGAVTATADGCGSALVTFSNGTQRRVDTGDAR